MVGMPYPNPTDVELRERMAFMDAAAAAAVGSDVAEPAAGSARGCPSPGQQYYQDLCMKVWYSCWQPNKES
jgi:chromosome transmission fidelity protein 1